MSVLESVLNYKRQKDAEARADIDAIPAGINAFVAAKQQAQKSMLDQLTYNMQLQKFNMDAQKQPLEMAALSAKTSKEQAEAGVLNKFMGAGDANQDVQATEATIGGVKFEKPALKAEMQRQQEDIKNTAKAQESLDAYSSDAVAALAALDKIEKKAESLGDFKRGGVEQFLSKSSMAIKEFSEDKSVNEFKQAIAQEMAPLVRKLAEEKGPLTDRDIDRAIEGVGGKLTRPLEDKKTALNDLREKVRNAVIAKAQAAKLSPEDMAKKYPLLHEKISKKNVFSSEADAKAAGLPDGTPVEINGVKGKWYN